MRGIFTRILKDKRTAFIAYSLGSLATVEMYIALFPAIRDQAQELSKLLEAYPKGFMEAFGFNEATAIFSKLEAYMSTEYFSFFWPIMVITMMIGFANVMIVTEVEKGTIELALAQPISRMKLFFIRYLAGTAYLAVFNFISVFGIIPFARLHNIDFQFANYVTIFFISFLFGMTIFSMAVLFSALFSEKGKAMAVSAAVLLSMYVANIVSTLKDSLENVRYFSIFYYYNPTQTFGSNEIVDYAIPVFLGAIVVLTLLSALWFSRRDVAV